MAGSDSKPVPPFVTVARELAAGTVGGTAQIIVGHPFDTVKVKLQSMKMPAPGAKPQYSGAMDVVRQVVRAEGGAGLFAGIQAPLPFVAIFNATLFATNGAMRRIIGQGRKDDELSIAEIGMAAGGAGAAVSFVACPTELVKCRLQTQPGVFNGAIDCTRQVVANRGMTGLFTGFYATVLREMSGNALYFMAYTSMLRAMAKGGSTSDLESYQYMMAGGLAGLAFWGPCYPIDYAKTLLQTDNEKNPKYRGLMDCVRQTVRRNGVGAMYNGVGPCLARSVPANAVTFLAYEYTKKKLSSQDA